MAFIGRHPIATALGAGIGIGAAFLILEVQVPSWLAGPLLAIEALFPFAFVALLASGFAVRRRMSWARPIAIATAAWVGFVFGFFILGLTTCAFCLS